MSIATSIDRYLARAGIIYDIVTHPHTANSSQSAEAAHVPGGSLAKSVLLQDERGYLVAVLPASRKLDLDALYWELGRDFRLAPPDGFPQLFSDCEPGAIPPLATAYGLEAIVDDALVREDDVYFEAGDHRALVHVSGDDFRKLMADARQGPISQRH